MNTPFSCLKPAFIQYSHAWDFDLGDIPCITFGLLDDNDDFVLNMVIDWDANGVASFLDQDPNQKELIPFWIILSCRAAIAETADRIFTDELDKGQQDIARRIFLHLVQVNENEPAGETRRRATFDELVNRPEEGPVVRQVLTLLADSRLVITQQNDVELAHEALIREWPTLRTWLDEDREGLLVYRHLAQAALMWDRLKRDPGELYRGGRLSQAREWAAAHPDQLNSLQMEFMAASQAH